MSNRTLLNLFRWLPLAAIAILAGCGHRELPKKDTYPVQGTVRLHGQPAVLVLVRLTPVDGRKGGEAQGTTDANGHFELRTYSQEEADGALPGEYKVILEESEPVQFKPGVNIPPGVKATSIPKGSLDTGITVQIRSEPNDVEIDVP
jgi:hypothetical protein